MSYADNNREWLEPYIHDIAARMHLSHWKIALASEDPDDGNDGHCQVIYGRRSARIILGEPSSREELRQTIIHELLHIILDPLRLPIENVRGQLGEGVYSATHGAHIDALEYATDAIATAWAERLPLPEVPRRESEAA